MNRTVTPQALKERIDKEKNILVLDVRRDTDYEADREMIPDAIKRNPEQVEVGTRNPKRQRCCRLLHPRGLSEQRSCR